MTNSDGGQQTKKSPPTTPAFKKRHRGCSYCILDIENTPIPEFPSNEEVVGVITMEDVIEELLQVNLLQSCILGVMKRPTIFGTFILLLPSPWCNDINLFTSGGGLIAWNNYFQYAKKLYGNYMLISFVNACF